MTDASGEEKRTRGEGESGKASGNFVGQSFTRLADGFFRRCSVEEQFFEESSDISSRRFVLNERTGKEMAVELAESGPFGNVREGREEGC